MRKVISAILSLVFVLSLAACGGEKANTNEGSNTKREDSYVSGKDDTVDATTPSTRPATEATTPTTTEEMSSAEMNPDFKAAMDSYEEFFDKYVAIMKKYKENPTDLSILADYATYMGQYADMIQKLEEWENKDLNTAEAAYYVDVQARITKKLLEVA
jgi:hypothetical protein